MIEEIEKAFIDQYVKKYKRERLLFELSGKKRQHGIGRFCHNAEEMVKADKIVMSGNKLFADEILAVAKQYGTSGMCYIIAFNEYLDGKQCTLKEALKRVLSNGMAAIIVCDNFAVVETEQCEGTPMRYILH